MNRLVNGHVNGHIRHNGHQVDDLGPALVKLCGLLSRVLERALEEPPKPEAPALQPDLAALERSVLETVSDTPRTAKAIASEVGRNISRVREAIARLVDRGLLRRTSRGLCRGR